MDFSREDLYELEKRLKTKGEDISAEEIADIFQEVDPDLKITEEPGLVSRIKAQIAKDTKMTINQKFRWTFHLDFKENEVQLGDSAVFVKSVELPVVSSNPPHKKFTSLKVVYYDAKDNRDFKKLIVSKLGYVQFKGTLVYYDRSGDETDKIIFDLGSATIKFSDLNYLDSEECTISIEFEVKGMNFDLDPSLARATSNTQEPDVGEGWRMLVGGDDVLQEGDEFTIKSSPAEWRKVPTHRHGSNELPPSATYRRRGGTTATARDATGTQF